MSAPPAQPAAAAAPGPPALRDFPDRFSPMLVKELRQGTRTRVFAAAFIIVQAILALTLLASLAYGGGEALQGFFWWVLVVVLLIIMPLRGFNALANEERLQTIDLILLTRLTALRITAGKWAALLSQSALFVAAVLPYVVLRYFLGGVNVIVELIWVAILLAFSAMLTAFTVGFSAHRMFLIRIIVALAVIGSGFAIGSFCYEEWFSYNELPTYGFGGYSWLGYALFLLICGFATYYALDMGATIVAPAAENHSTRKRLVTAGVVAVLLGVAVAAAKSTFSFDEDMLFVLACIIAIVACFDALAEQPVLIRSVFAPFARRGFAGRLAGRFLYPGWHTGVWFTLALTAAIAGVGIHIDFLENPLEVFINGDRPEAIHNFTCVAALLIVPAAVVQVFFGGTAHVFALTVVIHCIASLYTLLLVILANVPNVPDEVYWAGSFVPLTLIVGAESDGALLWPFYFCALCLIALSTLVLTLRARRIYTRTSELEMASLEMRPGTSGPPGHPDETVPTPDPR